MRSANGFGGSCPWNQVGIETEPPPPGQRLRTSKAAVARSVTGGVNEGTAAGSVHASAGTGPGCGAAYAPGFAASIAPGPPPVATAGPSRARARPGRAAAYGALERSVAWPPITPPTRAPVRNSSSASETAPSARVRRNHREARASGVAA